MAALIRTLWVLHQDLREIQQTRRKHQQCIRENKEVLRMLLQSPTGRLSNLSDLDVKIGSGGDEDSRIVGDVHQTHELQNLSRDARRRNSSISAGLVFGVLYVLAAISGVIAVSTCVAQQYYLLTRRFRPYRAGVSAMRADWTGGSSRDERPRDFGGFTVS